MYYLGWTISLESGMYYVRHYYTEQPSRLLGKYRTLEDAKNAVWAIVSQD